MAKLEIIKQTYHAAEKGHAEAQYAMGCICLEGNSARKDCSGAGWWFRKSATQGHIKAQAMLGKLYFDGLGVEESGAVSAEWYRRASDQGYALAQCVLGMYYVIGYGVDRDYEAAVKWFRKAAEQGQATAQRKLGEMYFNGRGIQKNVDEAVKWYRKAAGQEDKEAQLRMGAAYYRGCGVSQNVAEAIMWFEKAGKVPKVKGVGDTILSEWPNMNMVAECSDIACEIISCLLELGECMEISPPPSDDQQLEVQYAINTTGSLGETDVGKRAKLLEELGQYLSAASGDPEILYVLGKRDIIFENDDWGWEYEPDGMLTGEGMELEGLDDL